MNFKLAIIGTGYVGLALAVTLGKYFEVKAIDADPERISNLQKGFDVNREFNYGEIKAKKIIFTNDYSLIKECDTIFVTVPLPIDEQKKINFEPVFTATEKIAEYLAKGSLIIYESTFYPGITEEKCIPLLEKFSGMKHLQDFFVGYSPERINPGDAEHTLEKTVKVIAADSEETIEKMEKIYGLTGTKLWRAKSIKTAEMAKLTENIQRAVNISFINEMTMICQKFDLSVEEVLAVAETKWNFLPFKPGLIGGYCISNAPIYLNQGLSEINSSSELLKTIIKTNEKFKNFLGELINEQIEKHLSGGTEKTKILILGASFKENIGEVRNSEVFSLIKKLEKENREIFIHDPLANPKNVSKLFGYDLCQMEQLNNIDCLILAVSHEFYRSLIPSEMKKITIEKPLLLDLKSFLAAEPFIKSGFIYRKL